MRILVPLTVVAWLSTALSSATQVGVTHTQHSLDPWNDAEAVARGEDLLSSGGIRFQNQHIMGWGGGNPEPSPGEYDWGSLDTRVEMMRRTGARMVITLCCAPDWMKGGEPGETDWSNLEVAPLPEHYSDFADLCAKVAERYPDVEAFQVWNELKGFWNKDENRWAYENYTEMYNMVYLRVKEVNPVAKIGGPYTTSGGQHNPSDLSGEWGYVDQRLLDAIEYWLAYKAGADFVCIDGNLKDTCWAEDYSTAVKKFSDINLWLRERTPLPIWWSEWYPLPGETEDWEVGLQADMFSEALGQMGDAEVVLTWPAQGEGTGSREEGWNRGTMWNDTKYSDGGYPTDFFQIVKEFNGEANMEP